MKRNQRATVGLWRRILRALALFALATMAADLYLTTRLTGLYQKAATLNDELAKQVGRLPAAEAEALSRERRDAERLMNYDILVDVALVALIVSAALYGLSLTSKIESQSRERETLIAQLQASEATLERGIRERTAALVESEARFQLVSRATSEAIWDWDIVHDTIWSSDGFYRIFGAAGLRNRGERRERIHPDDVARVWGGVDQFLQSDGEAWSAEYRYQRHDGTYAWVLDRAIAVRDSDGKPLRMLGSMMDITERKEAERMKSDFVSFVSHQLRTPLSGMSWMLELAAETDGLPPEAREYIADARESASRLVSLVNDLLDIARLENGRMQVEQANVPLAEVTRSVLHEFQGLIADKRHDVQLHARSAPDVWADPQLLRQVVLNLLSNAIKYTPEGGRIDVRIEQQNGVVEWSVEDNGLGIPVLAQSRLFEKFYRADNVLAVEAEGTGLGLHLVRLIVQQAGGRVWCESQQGKGSTFAFTIPAGMVQGEAR